MAECPDVFRNSDQQVQSDTLLPPFSLLSFNAVNFYWSSLDFDANTETNDVLHQAKKLPNMARNSRAFYYYY